jgi:hypothetical protein
MAATWLRSDGPRVEPGAQGSVGIALPHDIMRAIDDGGGRSAVMFPSRQLATKSAPWRFSRISQPCRGESFMDRAVGQRPTGGVPLTAGPSAPRSRWSVRAETRRPAVPVGARTLTASVFSELAVGLDNPPWPSFARPGTQRAARPLGNGVFHWRLSWLAVDQLEPDAAPAGTLLASF